MQLRTFLVGSLLMATTTQSQIEQSQIEQSQIEQSQIDGLQSNNLKSSKTEPLEHFYVTCKGENVAEGVILPSGAFALSWLGKAHSHGTYPDLDVFRNIQSQMSGREIVATPTPMGQTFYLQRNEDWNGISGTGKVAVGYEFDRITVLQWLGEKGSTFWYESVEQVEWVHGHEGRTVIVRVKA
ncbi:MAG: hypothetical protein AAFQ63_09630 [Cyanobacteria bacterium J06621_11]